MTKISYIPRPTVERLLLLKISSFIEKLPPMLILKRKKEIVF